MIRSVVVALVLAVFAGGVAGAASPAPSFQVKLLPQHGSKIGGEASIVHDSAPRAVVVTIVLDGVFIPENEYPAGVYEGSCSALSSPPAYKLNPVKGGRSVTNLHVKQHMAETYSIAVFDTAGTKTTSCGTLPAMKHDETKHDAK